MELIAAKITLESTCKSASNVMRNSAYWWRCSASCACFDDAVAPVTTLVGSIKSHEVIVIVASTTSATKVRAPTQNLYQPSTYCRTAGGTRVRNIDVDHLRCTCRACLDGRCRGTPPSPHKRQRRRVR